MAILMPFFFNAAKVSRTLSVIASGVKDAKYS